MSTKEREDEKNCRNDISVQTISLTKMNCISWTKMHFHRKAMHTIFIAIEFDNLHIT